MGHLRKVDDTSILECFDILFAVHNSGWYSQAIIAF